MAVSGCAPRADILSRLPSPDGKLDAVLAQPRTGATVGFAE